MNFKLVPNNGPDEIEQGSILRALRAFNRSQASPDPIGSFAVSVKDDAGAVTGGLWADYGYDWMFIKYLIVPESARGKGLGKQMMEQAEARARELGLYGIWLDTFTFQAKGFYEKLGYEVFGTIENFPRGGASYHLKKVL